ncbi:MAG: hypothetical protein ACREM2_10540, partial [Vulcanimicrobiaceae bacterium]
MVPAPSARIVAANEVDARAWRGWNRRAFVCRNLLRRRRFAADDKFNADAEADRYGDGDGLTDGYADGYADCYGDGRTDGYA